MKDIEIKVGDLVLNTQAYPREKELGLVVEVLTCTSGHSYYIMWFASPAVGSSNYAYGRYAASQWRENFLNHVA